MKNPIGYEILSISDGILTYIDYLPLTKSRPIAQVL